MIRPNNKLVARKNHALENQGKLQKFYDDAKQCNLINWDRISAGCEYRAEAAIKWFKPTNMTVMKIWCFPRIYNKETDIGVVTIEDFPLTPARQKIDPERPFLGFDWAFHVAPVCLFEIEKSLVARVIDPSLHNGPTSIGRWLYSIGGNKGRWMLTSSDIMLVDTKTFVFYPAIDENELGRELQKHFDNMPKEIVDLLPAKGDGDGDTFLD